MKKVIQQKFDTYPKHIKPKMGSLRNLIFEVAKITEGFHELKKK